MKKIFIYLIPIFLLFSCDNYLDIEPKGKTIPKTVKDYDLLLTPITELYIEDQLFLSTDDFISDSNLLGDLTNPNNTELHMYSFSDKRFSNPDIGVNAWNKPYENIYVFNKIINEIDEAEKYMSYTEQDRKRIKAEAQYGRALQYLFLVNMFAKHYDKATATSEAGIPIVKVASTSQKAPSKSSVEEVYKFILNDLNEAVKNLPKRRKTLNRPSKGSGYALLARTYLYQNNYEKALENANFALAESSTIEDHTTSTNIGNSYAREQYSNLTYGYIRGFTKGFLAPDLVALFDKENDVRIQKIVGPICKWVQDENGRWKRDCDYTKYSNGYRIEPNMTVSIPEMYLIVAECYARKSDSEKALEAINKLRKKRIKNVEDKVVSDFGSKDELLKFILEERRRELFMSGTRLFDLKRLNLDSKFAKKVVHPLDKEIYEAAPNSGKLVFPIPAQVKKFNPSL